MMLRTRLAPTPSGFLHIGNLYSFLITWLLARKQDGKILLRIDDLDNQRTRKKYIADIFETLAFLEIDYHEGPRELDDFFGKYSQQHRIQEYNNILQKLADSGVLYACTCSRKEMELVSENGKFKDPCKFLKLPLNTEGAAWRINIPNKTIINFTTSFLEKYQSICLSQCLIL